MIGMMNVPCESPTEFYAAPKTSTSQSLPSPRTAQKQLSWSRKSSKRISVFVKRRLSHQVDYLKDGRKVRDGELMEKETAPKMWEKLLVRSFVHKIEDEIQSPVEEKTDPFIDYSKQPQVCADPIPQYTNSTWSLATNQKLERANELQTERPRSKSCDDEVVLANSSF
ncbi:unnamed protein product [Bursaphelenchus okinawaensis]|uniref:Uncharacterized protein n=1 Tax=Bursaphelenchus okinawaensis TaxID=465554 RepID=A0A811K8E3_9BILA|nr:unnamed protein product [Bursaphelenchus okinawaensis]CAG9093918.1 unnamed protein product [Bursaphelenchus okinawaensis]